MVTVTHDMWFARRIATRILFIADGLARLSGCVKLA